MIDSYTLLELAIRKSKTTEQTYGNIDLLTLNEKMECHVDSLSMVDSESIILLRWLSKMHSKVASIWRLWTLARGWGWLGGIHFCTAHRSNISQHPPPPRPCILRRSSIALSWQLCGFVRGLRRLGLVHSTDARIYEPSLSHHPSRWLTRMHSIAVRSQRDCEMLRVPLVATTNGKD